MNVVTEMHRHAGNQGRGLPPASSPGLARTIGVWLLVTLSAAFLLRVADAVPRVGLGVPRGVVRAPDLTQLERATGRRMPIPAYFPDSLAWPPADLRSHSSGSAAIWFGHRTAGGVALIVATAPAGSPGVASAVLPPSVELQREDGSLVGRLASISRVRDSDGAVWQQVQWQTSRQIILVRYRGTSTNC